MDRIVIDWLAEEAIRQQEDKAMNTPVPKDVTEDMEQVVKGPKFYKDDTGLEWCACDEPNLIHNAGDRGAAKCIDCQRPWFH